MMVFSTGSRPFFPPTISSQSDKIKSAFNAIGLSSSEIQNYELKAEIEKFKKETIESINIEDPNIYEVIDVKTDEFISKHGLMLENQEVEDEINDDKIDFI